MKESWPQMPSWLSSAGSPREGVRARLRPQGGPSSPAVVVLAEWIDHRGLDGSRWDWL